ncbi:hypothetical protein EXIGLDRAFT_844123 [Exidia glandulosa HHB12029]|uniref:DUF6535 domain-containing protein n=1 Tax=Exidia glandulosa HHB12029 TaxID=1314781 RepID=A0A165C8C2_EXIGL|nr:hypothetical protein EXIGLDRAFT_844123 [Exidia glandulosa HHB12029]
MGLLGADLCRSNVTTPRSQPRDAINIQIFALFLLFLPSLSCLRQFTQLSDLAMSVINDGTTPNHIHAGCRCQSTYGETERPDEPGDEMGPNARVWREYNKLAKAEDEERTRAWNRGLGGIGLFAGVFSGVTASFLIESYQRMQPDYTQLAYQALVATAAKTPLPSDKDFVVLPADRVLNCLWIASLMFSLSAALIAVMGAEWSAAYYDPDTDQESDHLTARQRAERRQFRANNVRRWRMPAVILTAPMLMQISMLLFGVGLALFFASIDNITKIFTSFLVGGIGGIWFITTSSPAFIHGSPFRTPLTPAWRSRSLVLYSMLQNIYRRIIAAEEERTPPARIVLYDPWMQPPQEPSAETLKSALQWLQQQDLFEVVYASLGDLSLGPRLAGAAYWRIDDRRDSAAAHHDLGHKLRVVFNSFRFRESTREDAAAVIQQYETDKTQPLTEDYLLARAIRGLSINETVNIIRAFRNNTTSPSDLPKLHTTTLVRLIQARDCTVGAALHILFAWKSQFAADPVPIVRAVRHVLEKALAPRPSPVEVHGHTTEPAGGWLKRVTTQQEHPIHDILATALHTVLRKVPNSALRRKLQKRLEGVMGMVFERRTDATPENLQDPIRMLCFMLDNAKQLRLFEPPPPPRGKQSTRPMLEPPTPTMALELLAFLCRQYPKNTSATQYTCIARTLSTVPDLLNQYEWSTQDVKFVLKRMPAPRLPVRRLLRNPRPDPASDTTPALPSPVTHSPFITASSNTSSSVTPSLLSGHVANTLVMLLGPDQKWHQDMTASDLDVLLSSICIRICAVFERAPSRWPVHPSVNAVLYQLLSHGSLSPLTRARGNRVLDLIHTLTEFFADHRPAFEGNLFALFLHSPVEDGSGGDRWELAVELPSILIGGLLHQQHVVSKILIALGVLRRRYTSHGVTEEFWRDLQVGKGVHEETGRLTLGVRARHAKMFKSFYKAMDFAFETVPLPSPKVYWQKWEKNRSPPAQTAVAS